ncbi:MAG: hypothetical protein P8Y23_06100 [Candidatus Lokiarchaeota archaeon]|jgi:tRNA (pseudouridine54-N1)-methyltransferase
MKIIFFIQSSTVNLRNYTIKNIPGSSGRLDVISRIILASMLRGNKLEKDVEIWVFLDNYGTFVFFSNDFNEESFPKNEIALSDYFVKFILKKQDHFNNNPLRNVKLVNTDIFNALKYYFDLNYQIFEMDENGQDYYPIFNELDQNSNLLFIIGNQTGEMINSEELINYKIRRISLGIQSYLASSVIRLIKLNLRLLI